MNNLVILNFLFIIIGYKKYLYEEIIYMSLFILNLITLPFLHSTIEFDEKVSFLPLTFLPLLNILFSLFIIIYFIYTLVRVNKALNIYFSEHKKDK